MFVLYMMKRECFFLYKQFSKLSVGIFVGESGLYLVIGVFDDRIVDVNLGGGEMLSKVIIIYGLMVNLF